MSKAAETLSEEFICNGRYLVKRDEGKIKEIIPVTKLIRAEAKGKYISKYLVNKQGHIEVEFLTSDGLLITPLSLEHTQSITADNFLRVLHLLNENAQKHPADGLCTVGNPYNTESYIFKP